MITALPLDLHGGHLDEGLLAFPLLGALLVILLAAAAYVLWRQGRLNLPHLRPAPSPEATARTILAERFANGDITTEEFLERASILNWAPGSDTHPVVKTKKR